ncbi:FHA domain-containing [Micractinium conductrix]|uniref:FHA domain-containing n=1 Tax=Micractinium conductrix TaxID=554055 RepID=A0A2P6V5F5_9CHLO|nr:FHA domain-containing [Micractinium conductrix]|eukprot:PSC69325.1 FHA domain-containing [Micractinium conductrix]
MAVAEAAPALLKLHIEAGPQAGKQLEKRGASLRVGRTAKSPLYIKDPSISEAHAELAWRDGGWHVRDLGSTNGTAVNGKSVEGEPSPWQPLKHGDQLRFGTDTVARVEIVAAPGEALTVEEFVVGECAQLEQAIRARAEQLSNQLRAEWAEQKQTLLMS